MNITLVRTGVGGISNAARAALGGLLLVILLLKSTPAQYLEATIPVGHLPADVLWNPTSNKVYVANTESYDVTIIDGATNAVIGTVPVPANSYLADLCWNSVENKVYCTSTDPDWLNVIDGAGDSLLHRVRMRGGPTYMAYNATMNKLYVTCFDDYMVRVYDGAADTLVAEVWLGDLNFPHTLFWHPVSNRVFCTTWGNADSVMVVDCALEQVVERREYGQQPFTMCWNPVNGLVYMQSRYAIYALTPTGDSVVATLDGWARDLCTVPFPNKLYASGRHPGLDVIDCDTHTVIDSVAAASGVLVCDTVRGKVYMAGDNWRCVSVIDARADTLLLSIPLLPGAPRSIAWNSTNGRVYVADDGADVVYVIRDSSTGIAEPEARAIHAAQRAPTLCRGRLWLNGGGSVSLLDLTGRQVTVLKSGDNDLSRLRSGVYFVRHENGSHAVKVILQN